MPNACPRWSSGGARAIERAQGTRDKPKFGVGSGHAPVFTDADRGGDGVYEPPKGGARESIEGSAYETALDPKNFYVAKDLLARHGATLGCPQQR